ncbi:MAG: hypothetical protein J6P03_01295 [Opitutales bacterium]|nr:hypothetical protein [Opitutales bacterium]
MKKIYMGLGLILTAGAAFAATVSQGDARAASEKIFANGGGFAEAVVKAQKNYAKWKDAEIADIKKSGVVFGGMRAVKSDDGNAAFSISINSPKKARRGITLNVLGYSELYLNGAKISENPRRDNLERRIFELDLNAGKNELLMKMTKPDRDLQRNYKPFFSPYADPVEETARRFRGGGYGSHLSLFERDEFLRVIQNAGADKILDDALGRIL